VPRQIIDPACAGARINGHVTRGRQSTGPMTDTVSFVNDSEWTDADSGEKGGDYCVRLGEQKAGLGSGGIAIEMAA